MWVNEEIITRKEKRIAITYYLYNIYFIVKAEVDNINLWIDASIYILVSTFQSNTSSIAYQIDLNLG